MATKTTIERIARVRMNMREIETKGMNTFMKKDLEPFFTAKKNNMTFGLTSQSKSGIDIIFAKAVMMRLSRFEKRSEIKIDGKRVRITTTRMLMREPRDPTKNTMSDG